MIRHMAQLGAQVESSSPSALGDLLAADAAEWKKLIEEIGFTADS